MPGSAPKVLLCTSDASEDFTPPSPGYHLHLRMAMAATTWFPLPHSGFAARALHTGMSPKSESIPGVSLCYTTRFPSLLYCDVLWQYSKRSFNLSFHMNKSMRQYLYFEFFLLSFQASPGENEDVGIFLRNKGNSKEIDHVENFVLEILMPNQNYC